MKALFLKDLMNLKSQAKVYILLLFGFSLVTFIQKDMGFLGGVLCLLAATLPMTAISYDERAKWDKYGLTMKVSRKTVVIQKYLLGLIVCFFCFLLSLALTFLTANVSLQSLLLCFIFFTMSLVVCALLLPFVYRFGTEKARVIMMIIFLLPLLLTFLADSTSLPSISEELFSTYVLLSPFAGLMIFRISLMISIKIYQKKEF